MEHIAALMSDVSVGQCFAECKMKVRSQTILIERNGVVCHVMIYLVFCTEIWIGLPGSFGL